MSCVKQGLQQQSHLLQELLMFYQCVHQRLFLPNEATDGNICHSHWTYGHFWKITFIGKDVYIGDKIFSWVVVKMFPAASSQKIYSFQFEFLLYNKR